MALYAINYDLSKPGQNYEKLIEAIKTFENWAHVLKSSWVIVSSNSASEIRDYLRQYIDGNDKLIVTRLNGDAAWVGLSDELTNWLRRVYV